MNDNYLILDGKRVELTEEQLGALGIVTRKSPFDRVAKGETYSLVGCYGYAVDCRDDREHGDNASFSCHNYFNDKGFANQVALHQLLYRKLLKFAYDNNCVDTAGWDGNNGHWCVYYNNIKKDFDTSRWKKFQLMSVYFSSEWDAERAIKEVVEPFVKDHPEFVW